MHPALVRHRKFFRRLRRRAPIFIRAVLLHVLVLALVVAGLAARTLESSELQLARAREARSEAVVAQLAGRSEDESSAAGAGGRAPSLQPERDAVVLAR